MAEVSATIQGETEVEVEGEETAEGGALGRSSSKSGEIDPYDMTIAPLNIYENQVIPVGLHNLSKGFTPNLSTIRVLSLGTKFIPKWK